MIERYLALVERLAAATTREEELELTEKLDDVWVQLSQRQQDEVEQRLQALDRAERMS